MCATVRDDWRLLDGLSPLSSFLFSMLCERPACEVASVCCRVVGAMVVCFVFNSLPSYLLFEEELECEDRNSRVVTSFHSKGKLTLAAIIYDSVLALYRRGFATFPMSERSFDATVHFTTQPFTSRGFKCFLSLFHEPAEASRAFRPFSMNRP